MSIHFKINLFPLIQFNFSQYCLLLISENIAFQDACGMLMTDILPIHSIVIYLTSRKNKNEKITTQNVQQHIHFTKIDMSRSRKYLNRNCAS